MTALSCLRCRSAEARRSSVPFAGRAESMGTAASAAPSMDGGPPQTPGPAGHLPAVVALAAATDARKKASRLRSPRNEGGGRQGQRPEWTSGGGTGGGGAGGVSAGLWHSKGEGGTLHASQDGGAAAWGVRGEDPLWPPPPTGAAAASAAQREDALMERNGKSSGALDRFVARHGSAGARQGSASSGEGPAHHSSEAPGGFSGAAGADQSLSGLSAIAGDPHDGPYGSGDGDDAAWNHDRGGEGPSFSFSAHGDDARPRGSTRGGGGGGGGGDRGGNRGGDRGAALLAAAAGLEAVSPLSLSSVAALAAACSAVSQDLEDFAYLLHAEGYSTGGGGGRGGGEGGGRGGGEKGGGEGGGGEEGGGGSEGGGGGDKVEGEGDGECGRVGGGGTALRDRRAAAAAARRLSDGSAELGSRLACLAVLLPTPATAAPQADAAPGAFGGGGFGGVGGSGFGEGGGGGGGGGGSNDDDGGGVGGVGGDARCEAANAASLAGRAGVGGVRLRPGARGEAARLAGGIATKGPTSRLRLAALVRLCDASFAGHERERWLLRSELEAWRARDAAVTQACTGALLVACPLFYYFFAFCFCFGSSANARACESVHAVCVHCVCISIRLIVNHSMCVVKQAPCFSCAGGVVARAGDAVARRLAAPRRVPARGESDCAPERRPAGLRRL